MITLYAPAAPKLTLPREPTAVGDPVVLPRRSVPIVLGLVVTSLVTMLVGTRLVTEATLPPFQRARPIELTLGSLGPVRANPPAAPAVPPASAPGDPARSTGTGSPPGAAADPPRAPDGSTRRQVVPGGAAEAPDSVQAVADRPAAGDAPGASKEPVRTLIGHRGLPCTEPGRPRPGPPRWRPPGSCGAPGTGPAPPAREPGPGLPPPERPPRRPRSPAPDPAVGPRRAGSPAGRDPARAAVRRGGAGPLWASTRVR